MICSVCNGNEFVLRDGYQYCTECGTRLADTQATIEYSDEQYLRKGLKKTKLKSDNSKVGSIWTTWHAHNMILAGLAEELGSCCYNILEFKKTTLKLWGMFLKNNQIAFFSNASAPLQPNLVYGCHRKDLEYLYDLKRPSRGSKHIRNVSLTRTQLKIKKSKSITQHFKKLISSQETDIASQSLIDLKSSSGIIEKPNHIILSGNFKNICKKNMTEEEITTHIKNGFCGSNCNCLFQKSRFNTSNNKNYLSIFNLYAILVLALRVNNEDAQMSDFLRWCREGHISYSTYDHFFPEDMVIKSRDPKFIMRPFMLNNKKLRRVAGLFAKEFNFEVLKPPNIEYLIKKYVKELELPQELNNYILKLAEATGPLPDFKPNERNTLPNYEAIAISYVIIALKMIFGLDDVTEKKISFNCNKINTFLSLRRQRKKLTAEDMINIEDNETNTQLKTIFIWQHWVEYIEYRKICLSEYHYPTRIRTYKEDYDKPELFLHYKKTIKRDSEKEYVNKNEMHSLIKTLIDDIEFEYNEIEETFPVFPVSLYPMSSYVEFLLIWKHPSEMDINRAILEEDFINYGVSVFFDYSVLEGILNKSNIKLLIYRARERKLCIEKNDINKELLQNNMSLDSSKDVEVINCTSSKWEQILCSDKISEMLLKGLSKDDKTQQSDNHKKQQTGSFGSFSTKGENIRIKQEIEYSYTETVKLNLCSEDYWIRHYKYDTRFTKIGFEKELDMHFPNSFSWLLRECANTIETSPLGLYVELCMLERKLITFLKKNNTGK